MPSEKPGNKGIIRHPGPQDVPALKALWRASFPEDREGDFVPWYFARRYDPDCCWLLEEAGELAAMCYAPPVQMQTAAGLVRVPYIQGVATAAEKRRQGLCRRLLAHVEAELAEGGAPFCVLKPFDPEFYRPLGYRFFSYLRRYNLSFADHFLQGLATADQVIGGEWRLEHWLRPGLPQAAAAVAEVYQEWCRGLYAYALRDEQSCQMLLEDHQNDGGMLLLARDREGRPLAYALYTATGAGIFLRELAYTRRRAARALLLALGADYREDTPEAVIIQPDDGRLAAILPQTLAGWQTLPFAMFKPLTQRPEECYNAIRGGYFYEYM